jgi:hypothetical protein
MDRDRHLRERLIDLLRGESAHLGFAAAVADFPDDRINARPANVDYTFWHLIEHLRFTQADILAYIKNPAYREPAWPAEYWPPKDAQATRADWDASVAAFERDLDELVAMVADESTDLFATVPSHDGHTLLREVLIVGDHNAYHVGELGILRQVERAWGKGHQE